MNMWIHNQSLTHHSKTSRMFLCTSTLCLLIFFVTLGGLSICLTGCSDEISPTHPYDPESPINTQARSSVTLRIIFPFNVDSFHAGSYLEWVSVEPLVEFSRHMFIVADQVEQITTSEGPQTNLVFYLDQLTPGYYVGLLHSPGFLPKSPPIFEVPIGASIDIEIPLLAVSESTP